MNAILSFNHTADSQRCLDNNDGKHDYIIGKTLLECTRCGWWAHMNRTRTKRLLY